MGRIYVVWNMKKKKYLNKLNAVGDYTDDIEKAHKFYTRKEASGCFYSRWDCPVELKPECVK